MVSINRIFELGSRSSLSFSTLFDTASLAIMVAMAAFVPTLGSKYFSFGERALRWLARHPCLSVSVSGVLALILAVGMSLVIRIPEPSIHDEFSYLLAADTFSQARLTNPTHPLWVHFESMQIIHQPSYASKYPPGQGLVMAVGQAIAGHPIVGVWVSTSLASAAICWMLFAWLPGYWALLGGILAALHPTMLAWSQNYWGGAVATLGGALVLGGFRRVVSFPRARDAFLMALGIVILANSRPYEGLVFSILPLAFLLVWMTRNSSPALPVLLRQVVLPMVAVITTGALAMASYNSRVTGNALRFPYQVHESTYSVAPTFIWQKRKLNSPPYNHREIARFHLERRSLDSSKQLTSSEWPIKERNLSLFAAARVWFTRKITALVTYFSPLVLALPFFMIPWIIRRDWWMRFALLEFVVFIAALFAVVYSFSHYAAPAVGLLFLLVLQGMRYMRICQWRGRPSGRFLVQASVLLWFASLFPTYVSLASVGRSQEFALRRAQIRDQLERDEATHLVIVRYEANHNPNREWVYNRADIDGAKVVWAREMSSVQELLNYFKDRQVWLLKADAKPPTLAPYAPR
jgi:hypothetical protein